MSEGGCCAQISQRVIGGWERFPPRFSLLFIRRNDSSHFCLGRVRARTALQRGQPLAHHLPFPGVADPRERAHPVADGASGGVRRSFQESRHCGLAPDGAQRAAQRRYGAWGPLAPRPRSLLAPQVFRRRAGWLLFLLSSPSCLGPVNPKTYSSAWEYRDMWLTPPPYLGLLLSSGFRDKKQELSGSMNCSVKIVPDYFCKVLLPIFTSSLPSPLFSYAFTKGPTISACH